MIYMVAMIKLNAHIWWWHVAINDEADRNLTSDPKEVELSSNFLELF